MPKLLGSLGARMALAFAGVALAAIAVLSALVLTTANREVSDLVRTEQQQRGLEIAAAAGAAYQDAGGWETADVRAAFVLAATAGAELTLSDPAGVLVAPFPPGMGEIMSRMRELEGPAGTLGAPTLIPVEVGGEAVGTVTLRFPSSGLPTPEQGLSDALTRTVGVGAALAAFIALAAAIFVSRRITRPVVTLTAAARRLERGDQTARAGLGDAPGELRELGAAFDRMADTLARNDELRRNLVADVAHEIRTPLTILRGSCEELVDGLVEPTPTRMASLHDELLRLGRIVDDLETLAAAEATARPLDCHPVDLAVVAAEASELLRRRFDAAGISLTTRLAPAVVAGDDARLHQIVANLLTNASKFTPTGGAVTVTVDTDGQLARLEVADTGPGISDDELPHVFERLWRGAASDGSAGSGVGLAIVAELVRAHNGQVHATSELGSGATFTVLLPCAGPGT